MGFAAVIEAVSAGPVRHITLTVPDQFVHRAGQYLLIDLPGGTSIPLSIASPPSDLPSVVLHYRSTPGDPVAVAMDAALNQWAESRGMVEVTISAPAGDCLCPLDDQPLLIVAAGTGAAQGFACSAQRAQLPDAPTDFLWCAQTAGDLYDLDYLKALPRVRLITKVDPAKHSDNAGMRWLKESAPQRYGHILIAGSPPFVYATTDVLLELGIPQACMMADAYSYAPR